MPNTHEAVEQIKTMTKMDKELSFYSPFGVYQGKSTERNIPEANIYYLFLRIAIVVNLVVMVINVQHVVGSG